MAHSLSFASVYGVAHFAKSLLWYGSEILFTFTLTEIFGLSPLAAGATIAIGLVVNAGADILVGRLLSKGNFDMRGAGRIQLVGALVSAVSFCGFGLSGFCTGAVRPFAIAGTLTLFRLVYPVMDVPQNALLALGARCGGGEHKLSSLRMIMGGCASLLVAASFAPLLQRRHADVQAMNFAALTALAAVLALGGSILLYRHIQSLRSAPTNDEQPLAQRQGTIAFAPILVLAGMLGLVSVAMGLFTRIEPYLSSFVIASQSQGGLTMTAIALGGIICQPLWSRVSETRGLWNALAGASLMWSAGATLLLSRLSAMELPLESLWLGLFGVIYGGGAGGVIMALWAITARTVRANPKASALAVAAIGAASKLGGALSAMSAALLLAAGNYHLRSGNLLGLVCYAPIVAGLVSVAVSLSGSAKGSLGGRSTGHT